MTVCVVKYEPDYDVVPQAIFWRPLRYFTLVIRDGEDGLDRFKGASFIIGNDIQFDLRVYRGHPNPEFTVTLYLPDDGTDDKRVSDIIDRIVKEMLLPITAIAWRRGQPFEYDKLERPKRDRLGEPEARIVVLKIAASQPDRTATMKLLREEVPKFVQLSPSDSVASKTRAREHLWQQIIRNVTSSHQEGRRGLFSQGFARKIKQGLTVTERGMNYLNSIGFSG
jgi:hypothetical protein